MLLVNMGLTSLQQAGSQPPPAALQPPTPGGQSGYQDNSHQSPNSIPQRGQRSAPLAEGTEEAPPEVGDAASVEGTQVDRERSENPR